MLNAAVTASGGHVPTLFATGDTPPFLASGEDPALVLRVPWQARHALAAESDRGRVLEMLQELSGPEGVVAASEYAHHPSNSDYQARVNQWVMAGWRYADQQRDHAEQVAAAAAPQVQASADMSDDELEDALTSPGTRHRRELRERESAHLKRNGGYWS